MTDTSREQDRLVQIKEKFARRRGTLQWFFAGDPGETFDAEMAFLIGEVERLRAQQEAARLEGLKRGAELAVETLEDRRDRCPADSEEYRYLGEIIDGLRVGLTLALAVANLVNTR